MADFRLGIDIGGSKIEITAMDRRGEILHRHRRSSPGSYDATLEVVRDLTLQTEGELGCAPRYLATGALNPNFTGKSSTLGIGLPGSHAPDTGLVRNSNALWLNGRPFNKDVEKLLNRAVRVENDANCFALSEAKDGAGAGAEIVLGVILGTGMGGGLVVNGQILTGLHHVASEWGHIPLPWANEGDLPLRPCFCGLAGCQERYLAGPALAREWKGEHNLSALGIVEAMMAGDERAKRALDVYTDRLARAFGQMITILDPDVIVLGGGVSNIDWLYPQVSARLEKYAAAKPCQTAIRRNKHGDSSGVRGAAWLWNLDEG